MTNSAGSAAAKAMKQVIPAVAMSISAVYLALFIAGCAGHQRFSAPPRILEIYSEARVATLHFPRGIYTLSSEDRRGYYYRAPGGVVEHTPTGARRRDGGIFVTKRNRDRLRGYAMMPYGLTHVGNLSRVEHEFRD